MIIQSCEKATQINPKNQDAWHFYSLMNYEACIYYSKRLNEEFLQASGMSSQSHQSNIIDDFSPQTEYQIQQLTASATSAQKVLGQKYVFHVVCAIKGLVQQLSLSDLMFSTDMTKTLQNTLRLLKLWFRHGNLVEIEQIVRNGFDKIDLKNWIDVIPQLLARVDIKDNIIRKSLIELLERISQKFPQALIYSLSVLQKSKTTDRRRAADQLIEKLKLK